MLALSLGTTTKAYATVTAPNGKESPSVSYKEVEICPSDYYSSAQGLKGTELLNKIAMIAYASAEENCRSRMLLRYFGEKNEHNCGQCDVCLQKHNTGLKLGEFQEIKKQILNLLSNAPHSSIELMAKLPIEKEKIEQTVSFLLSEEIIYLKNGILSS